MFVLTQYQRTCRNLTQSATRNIETICDHVRRTLTQIVQSELLSSEGALRIGLIAYRDHPPQDHVYIVKNCRCIGLMQSALLQMYS